MLPDTSMASATVFCADGRVITAAAGHSERRAIITNGAAGIGVRMCAPSMPLHFRAEHDVVTQCAP